MLTVERRVRLTLERLVPKMRLYHIHRYILPSSRSLERSERESVSESTSELFFIHRFVSFPSDRAVQYNEESAHLCSFGALQDLVDLDLTLYRVWFTRACVLFRLISRDCFTLVQL
jgi:hypothetical protein